jgi:hypothetical protein
METFPLKQAVGKILENHFEKAPGIYCHLDRTGITNLLAKHAAFQALKEERIT